MSKSRVVSVDVGGTFTDVLSVEADGTLRSFKIPSVAAGAPTDLFNTLGQAPDAGESLLYSTTVTINRVLSGDLPRIGLVVTAGFRELLETARLPASADAVSPGPLPPRLVPLEWVREIDARMDAEGQEVKPLDAAQAKAIAREFVNAGIDVVAVALLHAYLDPAHELALAQAFKLAAPDIRVVRSSVVLPQLREYERTLATALNAALVPVLEEHLEQFAGPLSAPRAPVWLMQSSGGLCSAESALTQPLGTALSGPGAAVVGMRWLAEQSGYENVITLDVGGTSTDVAVIRNGAYSLTTQGQLAHFPVRTTMIDVLSIGAGGGSIAHEAADRRWHVGPDSAGAEPGPACYDRGGDEATLTDAQLVLGRIPDALLGGEIKLDIAAARRALQRLGHARGFDVEHSARGVIEIATHNMCGAIRRMSVQRGHNPADYTLIAVGGAGPLHGAEVAELLGTKRVLIPPQPGLAAAWGLQVADLMREFVEPFSALSQDVDVAALEPHWHKLEQQAKTWINAEGMTAADYSLSYKMDLRYAGMSHDTCIECPADTAPGQRLHATVACFHQYFERLSGRDWRAAEAVEIINLRVAATVSRHKPALQQQPVSDVAPRPAQVWRAVSFFAHPEPIECPIHRREHLGVGQTVDGPAVIEQYESTTLVPPQWRAEVDKFSSLVLRHQA